MVVSPDDLLNAFRLYAFKRGLQLTLPQIKVARAVFYMIAREREMRDFFFGTGTGKSTLFDVMEQFGKIICHYNYELCASEDRPFDPRGLSPLRILYPIWNGARIEGLFEELHVVGKPVGGTLTGPCGHCGARVTVNITADDDEIILLCKTCQDGKGGA